MIVPDFPRLDATAPPPVVIGGGLAGLVAAWHLATRGVQPLVLEAAARPGGRLAGGIDVTLPSPQGPLTFPGEHGIHAVWGGYVNLRAFLARTGQAANLIPARQQEWIYARGARVRHVEMGSVVAGSLVPAPLHYLPLLLRPRFLRLLSPADLVFLPQVAATLFLAAGIDPIQEHLPLRGKTMADVIADWPPTLRALVQSLARNGLSDDPTQVPLAGFLAFMRFYTVTRRANQRFWFFPADPATYLLAPWIASIRDAGGRVQCGARVTRLERTDEGWTVTWAAADGGGIHEARTPAVVLALDAPAAEALLTTSPGTQGATPLLRWPRGLPTATIRLWYTRMPRSGAEAGMLGGAFQIDNFFWLDRIQPAFAAWHAATGGSVAEVQIYGPPALLAQPAADLAALTAAEMARAFPELAGTLKHAVAWTNPPAHTLFMVDTPSQHLGVRTPWPGTRRVRRLGTRPDDTCTLPGARDGHGT